MAALGLAISTLACSVDERLLTVADSGTGGSHGNVPGGILLTPSSAGTYDGSNPAGVVGAWWSTGDDYGPTAIRGTGDCPMAGFPNADCSVINMPTPGKPFAPDPNGLMCTSGIAARVLSDDGGTADYMAIWGNMIAFDLNVPLAVDGDGGAEAGVGSIDSGGATKGEYDAPAHGITGLAFDIYTPPAPGNFRVEFTIQGTEATQRTGAAPPCNLRRSPPQATTRSDGATSVAPSTSSTMALPRQLSTRPSSRP